LQSALLVFDTEGGFRRFLAADPQSGYDLRQACNEEIFLLESLVSSPAITALQESLAEAIAPGEFPAQPPADPREAFDILKNPLNEQELPRFHPQLVDSAVNEIERLIRAGTPPGEIVLLAPYLSDALRFSIMNRLEAHGIPARSHRPSRSLREEPASQALLTLSALAHPAWEIQPTRFDVAYAFQMALASDLVRAQLLAEIVYRPRGLELTDFEDIKPDMQERITYLLGDRYTQLQAWLLDYRSQPPLPFGEALSQPGFGYHGNLDAARTAASLVESARKFRAAMQPIQGDPADLGREYLAMLADGVIAAQYLQPYQQAEDAVLVSPATTFLMMNRPVSYQFWLDVGAGGWYERLSQPLTHPFVLSRHWEVGRAWGDADELAAQAESMKRMVGGLLRRCRNQVTLGISDLGESGYEQRGELLRAFQKVLQGAGR
jgi:hypothetical protein